MRNIRKGNDTNIVWAIYSRRGESREPYYLGGKNLSLFLITPFGKKLIEDFSVEENNLSFTFYGKDQRHSGVHGLLLVENDGMPGMHTLDKCKAFNLVDCSCQAGGGRR